MYSFEAFPPVAVGPLEITRVVDRLGYGSKWFDLVGAHIDCEPRRLILEVAQQHFGVLDGDYFPLVLAFEGGHKVDEVPFLDKVGDALVCHLYIIDNCYSWLTKLRNLHNIRFGALLSKPSDRI